MTYVHARIQAFLQQQTIAPLRQAAHQPDPFYTKAGVVPYINGSERRFLVMKPHAKHAHLPPPEWQLCKGTRMQYLPSGWRDLAEGEPHTGTPETLAATALREGLEELGLLPESIEQLHDLGPYGFASAKSGSQRQMWLFAARMDDENALLPMAELAATTAARSWMTAAEFARSGRGDHIPILTDIASLLEA